MPGYICNFLTLHCTVFTNFPKPSGRHSRR